MTKIIAFTAAAAYAAAAYAAAAYAAKIKFWGRIADKMIELLKNAPLTKKKAA